MEIIGRELALQLFCGLLVETISLILALLFKDQPKRAITIFIIGTITAGVIAFTPVFWTKGTPPEVSPEPEPKLPEGMLFFDDFEKESLTQWVNWVASSTIQNGEIHIADSGFLLAGSDSWDNYSIKADIRLISGEIDFGIVARFKNDNSYYVCQLWHEQIWLIKSGKNLAQGDFDWLATNSYHFDIGVSYSLRMDVNDNQITCYVNEEAVLSTLDSSYPTGKFGFRVLNTEVAIDRIEVFELPSTK